MWHETIRGRTVAFIYPKRKRKKNRSSLQRFLTPRVCRLVCWVVCTVSSTSAWETKLRRFVVTQYRLDLTLFYSKKFRGFTTRSTNCVEIRAPLSSVSRSFIIPWSVSLRVCWKCSFIRTQYTKLITSNLHERWCVRLKTLTSGTIRSCNIRSPSGVWVSRFRRG